MTLNPDRSFYSVICSYKGQPFVQEMNVEDMTFNKIVEAIRAGQIEDVLSVFEFNPAEGWSNDVTAEVMAALEPVSFEDLDEDPAVFPAENKIGAFEAGCGRWAA